VGELVALECAHCAADHLALSTGTLERPLECNGGRPGSKRFENVQGIRLGALCSRFAGVTASLCNKEEAKQCVDVLTEKWHAVKQAAIARVPEIVATQVST
jgi:hypothetical protein